MSGGMPELGSKISLISKADIRYEGRLFTVDPQECTIALANGESKLCKNARRILHCGPFTAVFCALEGQRVPARLVKESKRW